MPSDLPQLELWSHLQTQRRESFADAKHRLDSLVRLAERCSAGRSLLNIGCGDGYLERSARKRQWEVLSVDPEPKSVAILKSEGIDARCGEIESLPVASESVDIVVCTEIFEHLTPETLDTGLKEIHRVLLPGGFLIGTVPYREDLSQGEVFCPHCKVTFHRWGHHQSFDEATMASWLGRYLSVRRLRPAYFVTWNTLNWKGKFVWTARFAFAVFGVYGADANLLFVAAKTA